MPYRVERFSTNPLVYPELCRSIGDNINGPSLIKVPDWVAEPLGRYYLYFAHHDGAYIRLAYSDSLAGPWSIHKDGVLPLASSGFAGHIASPDVHVLEAEKQIRLYFHGSDYSTDADRPQYSRLAVSGNGLDFTAAPELLGNSYMRVFQWDGWWYALAMPGIFYRSREGIGDFVEGPTLFTDHMRHAALRIRNLQLEVIYTNVGDAPESLLLSCLDLSADWMDWRVSDTKILLKPEYDYEGANFPCVPSVRGLALTARNELRDPAVYSEAGEDYLIYAIAGEQGLAGARLI